MSTGGGAGGGGPRWRGAPARVRSTRSTARCVQLLGRGRVGAGEQRARSRRRRPRARPRPTCTRPLLLEAAAELEQREAQEPDRRDLAVEAPLVAQAVHEPGLGQQVVERGPVLLGHGRAELGRDGVGPPQRVVGVDVERGLQAADEQPPAARRWWGSARSKPSSRRKCTASMYSPTSGTRARSGRARRRGRRPRRAARGRRRPCGARRAPAASPGATTLDTGE